MNDPNSYSVGVLGDRNVVLAHQPGIGKATAASVAAACAISFKKVKLALVVGICGGVPVSNHGEEILLGDVVISKGVIQFDFGRQFVDHFKRKIAVEDSLGKPNARISSLLAKLETAKYRQSLEQTISSFLAESNLDGQLYPQDGDKLFSPTYRHKHQDRTACILCANCKQIMDPVCDQALQSTCQKIGCDDAQQIQRRRQNQKNSPMVHMGLIASGDSVIKSGIHRDRISRDANVIAFEMEGAGVWDTFPCVIIKGVSDYSDCHKSKVWQKYAAATAAACTKAFIQHW
jgi:nucleoside phosphorylase